MEPLASVQWTVEPNITPVTLNDWIFLGDGQHSAVKVELCAASKVCEAFLKLVLT